MNDETVERVALAILRADGVTDALSDDLLREQFERDRQMEREYPGYINASSLTLDASRRARGAMTAMGWQEVRQVLEGCLSFLRRAPIESQDCCCGDKIAAHNMGSGHAPVDVAQYYAAQQADAIEALLASLPPPPETSHG